MDKNKATILIPTLNEEDAIAETIKDFRNHGYNNILIIDGHSTDKTCEIARALKVQVKEQPYKGKGDAVTYGISLITTPYTILVDGDGTYPAYYAEFIQNTLEKGIDYCIGNRLCEYDKGAFKPINIIGNKLFTLLFKIIYKKNMRDVLSGYRGFKTECMYNLKAEGFEVEIEMCKLVVKNNLKYYVIPTRYKARVNNKTTKLHPFKDGWIILKHILNKH